MEKQIFWAISWDTNSINEEVICTHYEIFATLAGVAQDIRDSLDPNDPDEWNSTCIDIKPVLMTQDEFDALPER